MNKSQKTLSIVLLLLLISSLSLVVAVDYSHYGNFELEAEQHWETYGVGGTCISGTHMANASYRTMPICFATGQAAGVCAALAVKNNQTPRNVTAAEVQKELIRQGAKLKMGD